MHNALPEVDALSLSLKREFLGFESSAPFFISCMTGGSDEGFRANKNLAIAAQQNGIAVGTGSIRVLFEHPEVFEHFHLKRFATDVPVIANIGGVQLPQIDHPQIYEMIKKLEVQAIAVHLNPGQELYQCDGDRNFAGIRSSLLRFCAGCPVPVIVKETGFGIAPNLIGQLLDEGVTYVDVAGAGGTNWVLVEAYRAENAMAASAEDFSDWGIPTAHILAASGDHGGRVLASGGIRSGMDIAKSLALGAHMAGLALPFIRSEVDGGLEAVNNLIEVLVTTIKNVMVLTNSKSVDDLSSAPLWYAPGFLQSVESLKTGLLA